VPDALSGSPRIAAPALTVEPGQAWPLRAPARRVPGGLSAADWWAIQSQVAKLTAPDGEVNDGFGFSESVSGDTAIVGNVGANTGGNADQGAAYVFYRDQGGPDAWGQVAKLTAADGAAGDQFGESVSVSGDTAVVGAPHAQVGSQADQGVAYVLYRNQGGPDAWGQMAKLTAADSAAGDEFGWDVEVSGDTAVVGAQRADVGGHVDQGTAYVFYRNQGGADAWGQVAKLTAADGASNDWFSWDLSLSGDTAVVGAPWANVGAHAGQGAAYVFCRDQGGSDAWGQAAKLTAADGKTGDGLGDGVAVDGDTAIAAAGEADVGGHADQGAAYVFYRDQGGADAWGQVAKLTADDGAANGWFGYMPAISGDALIVGCQGAVVGGHVDQGATYVFYRNHGGPDAWGQVAKLTADDGAAGDSLGWRASLSGDTAVVGAAWADIGGNADQGAAYVFALPPAAEDDAYTTAEDTPLQVPVVLGVLANDMDPQGDPLTAVLDAGPAHGALDLHADGSFIYTPTADLAGLDTFTYHANDGQEDSNVATAEITVTPVNDAPVAANDVYTAPMNLPLVVAEPGVLLNDSDVENDPLTAVLGTGPSHGTLDLDADGAFIYTPTLHFIGVDTFTYHANDGAANSNVATVQITVTGHRIYLPLVLRNG
jgi:hypothetical protein